MSTVIIYNIADQRSTANATYLAALYEVDSGPIDLVDIRNVIPSDRDEYLWIDCADPQQYAKYLKTYGKPKGAGLGHSQYCEAIDAIKEKSVILNGPNVGVDQYDYSITCRVVDHFLKHLQAQRPQLDLSAHMDLHHDGQSTTIHNEEVQADYTRLDDHWVLKSKRDPVLDPLTRELHLQGAKLQARTDNYYRLDASVTDIVSHTHYLSKAVGYIQGQVSAYELLEALEFTTRPQDILTYQKTQQSFSRKLLSLLREVKWDDTTLTVLTTTGLAGYQAARRLLMSGKPFIHLSTCGFGQVLWTPINFYKSLTPWQMCYTIAPPVTETWMLKDKLPEATID